MPPDIRPNWTSPPAGAFAPGTRTGGQRRKKPKPKPKPKPEQWISATGIGGAPAPTTSTIARNGRPRTKVTLPGHNKGVQPANAGRRFFPDPLTTEETLRLLDVIPQVRYGRPWPIGIRNRALVVLLWRTGLRINEALMMQPHHIDFGSLRVTVMNGKGGKRRTVGIDIGGLLELQPWLLERAVLIHDPTAPLFCTVQKPGLGNQLNDAYVRQALHKYGKAADIPKRVHPHGFRHALAVALVREGFSLPHVQAQLGHSSVAVTALYVRSMGQDEAFDLVAKRGWPA